MKLTRTFTKEQLKSILIWMGVALALVGLDAGSKWMAETLIHEDYVTVIPHFIYFSLSHNTGIAFSGGADWGVWGRILNISISLIMSVVILWYWILHHEKMNTLYRVLAAMLSAGAVGNLIDRSFYWVATTGFDGVIDFIQFYLGGGPKSPASWVNPFATFNMADAYLSIGIVALLIYLIVDMIKNGDKSYTKDPRLNKKPQSIEQNNADGEKSTSEEEPKAEEQGE
jgi:signal peptidase II